MHEPTLENCLNGKYPLARFLYVYVNQRPGEPLDPLVCEFKYVSSQQGQENVVKDGFFPLPEALARQTLDLIKCVEATRVVEITATSRTPATKIQCNCGPARSPGTDRSTRHMAVLYVT